MFLKLSRTVFLLMLGVMASTVNSSESSSSTVPDNWDIRGLRIGMTLAEAEAAIINALGIERSGLKREAAFVQNGNERTSYTVSVSGYAKNETLAAHFNAPPGDVRAVAIARDKSYVYEPGAKPGIENMVNALREKYGAPDFVNDHFPNKPMLVWQSGEEQVNNNNVCVRFIGIKPGPLPYYWNLGKSRSRYDKADTCDYGLRADISGTMDGIVSKLNLTLVDKVAIKASGAETKAMTEAADAAQRQADEKAAAEVVPEL